MIRADVKMEPGTGMGGGPERSKGYGLVEFATGAEAQVAMQQLNGTMVQDRTIQVG